MTIACLLFFSDGTSVSKRQIDSGNGKL